MRILALEFLSKNEKRSRKRRGAKCPRKGHTVLWRISMLSTIVGQVPREAYPGTRIRATGQSCPMPIHISINVLKCRKTSLALSSPFRNCWACKVMYLIKLCPKFWEDCVSWKSCYLSVITVVHGACYSVITCIFK